MKKGGILALIGVGIAGAAMFLRRATDLKNNVYTTYEKINDVGISNYQTLWVRPSVKITNASNEKLELEKLTLLLGSIGSGSFSPMSATTPKNISIDPGKSLVFTPQINVSIASVASLFQPESRLKVQYKVFGQHQEEVHALNLDQMYQAFKQKIGPAIDTLLKKDKDGSQSTTSGLAGVSQPPILLI